MRELLLHDLQGRIRRQRAQVARDREDIERAVTELPERALRALGSPAGLASCFALGAAAASGAAPVRGGAVWDLLARVALAQLPAVVDLIRELDSDPAAGGDPGT